MPIKSSCYLFTVHLVKMKMLLTVVIGLVLYTNRLVVADDQCTRHQFKSPFYPGSSCEDIYNKNPESRDMPGYYWITDRPRDVYCGMNYTGVSCVDIYNNYPETSNRNGYYPINSDQWTYCNMTGIANGHIILSCAGVDGLWTKIADVDISAGDDCPTEWSKGSYNGVSFCRRPDDFAGCYSAFFPTNGVSYQQVCGRARGYQKGSTDGFYTFGNEISIDTAYVQGLSITHGNPRQHIWSYAMGVSDYGNYRANCPCAAIPGEAPPSFVGNNYYCESGGVNIANNSAYFLSNPLWDGEGCIHSNCCSDTTQPWFYHQLSEMTQDDIEVRICLRRDISNEDVLVDILELYIQ